MEKIEEKAHNYLMSSECDGSHKDIWINGYDTRNDEVVKLIEAQIEALNYRLSHCTNSGVRREIQVAKDELTTLLQTIKGLDAPTKKPH